MDCFTIVQIVVSTALVKVAVKNHVTVFKNLYVSHSFVKFLSNNKQNAHNKNNTYRHICREWWLCGKFGALSPEGRRFESHSSHHVGNVGKFFPHNCPQGFGMLTPPQHLFKCC